MWFEPPEDLRLWIEQRHHLELIHRATESRLVKVDAAWIDSCDDTDDGLRARLGGLLVSAGNTLLQRDAPCNDPCPDFAR